jgi:hypothetical protein
MSESLEYVIAEIGKLNDRADQDKWIVCEAIASAYAELHAYAPGLTAGLCQRLRRSSDAIYLMRDAYIERDRLRVVSELPYSHFSTMYHLQDRYDLSDEEAREWIQLAEEGSWSIRDLRQEVEARCTQNLQKVYMLRAGKLHRQARMAYQDSEYAGVPDKLRLRLQRISALIEGWEGALRQAWNGALNPEEKKPPLK